MSEEIQPGTLYIVSTPIGNLEDITFRAVKILSGVDLIAAEDTRKTKILLEHYNIKKELISYFQFNEAKRTPELIESLKSGKSIAIVSDAGTPGISDPAYRLVRAAIDDGINIIPIPGASALLAALVVSGLPTDGFVFEGFLPHKKGRRTKLEHLKAESRTIILYESPHRILKTLQQLQETFGDRQVAVAREITKKFEEVFRGTLSEALNYFSSKSIKGEFVLVVKGIEND
ncbi:MAG: 16S rRNA (cytidine(1402)-2'-O)-methyltransferase [Bacteroidota bacterium]|nr:16S rRNA (cytidine(1402)-2'-O)-methyltransferase [Bacteroidota bacterium]